MFFNELADADTLQTSDLEQYVTYHRITQLT